jgi:hypothetical protein
VTNLFDLHPDCETCHGSAVRQAVKDAIARTDGLGKRCSACHLTTISDPGLHPNYTASHNVADNGCTGADCHPATALTVHGRTGCYTSCHNRPGTPLSLTCSTDGCHTGRVSDYTTLTQDLAGHVAVHADCNSCHIYFRGQWHNPFGGAQPLDPVTAASDCSDPSCHPQITTPFGVAGFSRAGPHTTRLIRWHEINANSNGLHGDSYSCTLSHCHSPNRRDWIPPVP